MIATHRSFACMLSGCILVASFTGCEDSTARRQTEVQQTINEAGAEYRRLVASASIVADEESTPKAQATLTQLADRLARLDGASPGQESAAALLSSSIRTELGNLTSARLARFQTDQRLGRTIANGLVDAGLMLEALASADEQFDAESNGAQLDAVRRQAIVALEAVSNAISQLDKPITTLNEANRVSLDAALILDEESRDLKRQAVDSGPSAGFRYIEQAAMKRTEADALRIGVARNEIELARLEPERNLASATRAQLDALVLTTEQAAAELGQFAGDTEAEANQNRQRIGDVRDALGRLLAGMATVGAGEMDALYAQSSAEYDKAATSASRAASAGADRTTSSAARMATATARQAQANLHWSRASDLDGQIRLLERIAASGDLLAEPGACAAALDASRTARETALEQAKSSYEQALQAIQQAGGDQNLAASIQGNITLAIEALAGASISDLAAASSPAGGGATGAAGSGGGATGGPGFESPDAALQFLASIVPGDAAQIRTLRNGMKSATPQAEQASRILFGLIEDGLRLNQVLVQQFGADAVRRSGGGPGGLFGDLANASVTTSGGSATISQGGGRPDIKLVRAGDRWFFDTGSALGIDQMPPQALGMLQSARGSLKRAFAEFAGRVQQGEFSSMEEAESELAQLMLQVGAASGGFATPNS